MIYNVKKQTHKLLRTQDYANDIALLANTLSQAESPLHSLDLAAVGIGLHVNAEKKVVHVF